MSDFIRARSNEQKEKRMEEIKNATDALFDSQPYHKITLTTIADKLNSSRANLYKYVTTKEEIFLELSADKRTAYFDSLKAAFPIGCNYSVEVFAQVWAGILNSHRSYLQYSDILLTIIETNVSVERLAAFKKNYYKDAGEIIILLSNNLNISTEKAEDLFYAVYYHAIGMNGSCFKNPLVQQALKLLNMEIVEMDFQQSMKEFILMCLNYYCQ